MTQKARVLSMLRNAGERGVRSDTFYREFLGRGVARVYDLRQDGYEISSKKEGKYTRYKLVGLDAGTPQGAPSSVLSGQSRVGGRGERVLGNQVGPSAQAETPAANATPDSAARLFDLPAMSAITNREAA